MPPFAPDHSSPISSSRFPLPLRWSSVLPFFKRSLSFAQNHAGHCSAASSTSFSLVPFFGTRMSTFPPRFALSHSSKTCTSSSSSGQHQLSRNKWRSRIILLDKTVQNLRFRLSRRRTRDKNDPDRSSVPPG